MGVMIRIKKKSALYITEKNHVIWMILVFHRKIISFKKTKDI